MPASGRISGPFPLAVGAQVDGAEPSTTTYEWGATPVYDDLKSVVRAYRRRHGIKATDS